MSWIVIYNKNECYEISCGGDAKAVFPRQEMIDMNPSDLADCLQVALNSLELSKLVE